MFNYKIEVFLFFDSISLLCQYNPRNSFFFLELYCIALLTVIAMVDSYNAASDHYEVEYEPAVRPTGYIDLDAANENAIPTRTDTHNVYDQDQLMADMAEHEEDVWDDSALIEAWDAAFNEYQVIDGYLFYSIK
jgi:hypothetical protein